ncbi:TetR/AcrR family transcriptional regulator [Paenibacillus sp. J22TS3]|uniref:TetR/AcrR family transcriptional regulator n=1 Tax=Paenibacillus sp. J22TS3 TaxID=2807192 RepID=UPI001B0B1BAE|nr:TetR/AcrR family transcriptional regulator [Paenibacillus sp. J22TS3]GIP21826.1 TetR family transcriptional regulator [Paenibacillus sp. J22TS3]
MTEGKRKLQKAALLHFARDGYEGASLQHIAQDAGMKKPSIYAHFKGKEELFMSVLSQVFKEGRHRITAYFLREMDTPLEQRLHGLFLMLQEEYMRNRDTKFLLRMIFFPPHAVYEEVMAVIYPFLDSLENRLVRLLKEESSRGNFVTADIRQAAVAFMTFADGIMVELLYENPERSRKRLDAVWPVYWKGISM